MFTRLGCPELVDDGSNSFATNVSRSQVSFNVDINTPNCARPTPENGITMLNTNENCSASIMAGELVTGLTFEPRCMVLVIAPDNEQIMFNEMMASGRIMSEDFSIEVNYTVATGSTPDIKVVNSNCGNSRVLEINHQLDMVMQDELTQLETVRTDIAMYTELWLFWVRRADSKPGLHRRVLSDRTRGTTRVPHRPTHTLTQCYVCTGTSSIVAWSFPTPGAAPATSATARTGWARRRARSTGAAGDGHV